MLISGWKAFWNMLGDQVDGKVVSLVVTKVIDYREISLVYQGVQLFTKR